MYAMSATPRSSTRQTMFAALHIFGCLLCACHGARPTQESKVLAASQEPGSKEPHIDEFIGEELAAATNAQKDGPAHYFPDFKDYYDQSFSHEGQKLVEDGQLLQNRANTVYDSMEEVDRATAETAKQLHKIDKKAKEVGPMMKRETRDVAKHLTKSFDRLEKFHEAHAGHDKSFIDQYYESHPVGELKEADLLAEGLRHKESGKFDFWANEKFPPVQTPQLEEAPKPQHGEDRSTPKESVRPSELANVVSDVASTAASEKTETATDAASQIGVEQTTAEDQATMKRSDDAVAEEGSTQHLDAHSENKDSASADSATESQEAKAPDAVSDELGEEQSAARVEEE